MMEIKQSPPNGVELNDLKKDPINGLKRQSDSELGSNDILQLSDSENEDGDISTAIVKTKSPPQFLSEVDLMNTLEKVNGEAELDSTALLDRELNTQSLGPENKESNDIDIFADELFKQIDENKSNGHSNEPAVSSNSNNVNKEAVSNSDNGNNGAECTNEQKDDVFQISSVSDQPLVAEVATPSAKSTVEASVTKESEPDISSEPQTVPESNRLEDKEVSRNNDEKAVDNSETDNTCSKKIEEDPVSKMDVDETIELDDDEDEDNNEKMSEVKVESGNTALEDALHSNNEMGKGDNDLEEDRIKESNDQRIIEESKNQQTIEDSDDQLEPLSATSNPIGDSMGNDKSPSNVSSNEHKDLDPLLSEINDAIGDEATEKDKTKGESIEVDLISLGSPCVDENSSDRTVNPAKQQEEEIFKDETPADMPFSNNAPKCEERPESEDDDVVLLDENDEYEEQNKESKGEKVESCEDLIKNSEIETDNKNVSTSKQDSSTEESIQNTAVDNDDDDVVLLDVDDKSNEGTEQPVNEEEKKTEECGKDEPIKEKDEILSTTISNSNKEANNEEEDDDVVLLEEDIVNDDKVKEESSSAPTKTEDVSQSTKGESVTSGENADEKKQEKFLGLDNSDNAQDKFPDDSAQGGQAEGETVTIDTDNLLEQVASPQNSRSNDQFDDEEAKQSDTESSELSQDISKKITIEYDSQSKDISIEPEEDANSKAVSDENINSENKSMKRSLTPDVTLHEVKKVKMEKVNVKKEEECKETIMKNVEDVKLINEIDKKKADLNLDFLKRFKKSLGKITKSDLEELVLQKIVEAIIHRSELSDMRELIEKQEKLIATHRTKIAEISKQFRDLEMVHNRVVKDLEMKNQQFIMPVKITRAVGLQVLIPKRSEHASNSSSKSMPSTPATPISSKTINSPATPAAPSNDSGKRSRTSEVTAPEPAKRIRCNQKVTPLRPDTPQRTMLNNAKVPPTLSPATPTNSTQSQQSTPTNSNKQPMAFKTVIRNVVPSQQGLTPPQGGGTQTASQIQLVERVTQISNNSQVTSNTAARKSVTPKPGQQQQNISQKSTQNNFQTSPERPRVPPVILKKTTNGRSLTVANPQTNSPSQGTNTGSNTIPNKSVIDLTDEDDKPTVDSVNPPALVAIPQNSKPAAHTQAQNRVTTYVISKPQTQRVSTAQNGTIRASPKTSYVPIAPKPSAQATQAGLNQRATPTNTATANSAAPKRASVPAPLPKPPNVPSNPLWKAPPSRPSIRINNIDTGIVISWTMDDMTADYAEVTSYQIYAYQESSAPPQVESWRHVGDVKAMLLPMAVTLTQFQEGQRYFFAVRAIDEHSRYGPFSMPKTWS